MVSKKHMLSFTLLRIWTENTWDDTTHTHFLDHVDETKQRRSDWKWDLRNGDLMAVEDWLELRVMIF